MNLELEIANALSTHGASGGGANNPFPSRPGDAGLSSTLFRGDPELIAVLQGRLRLGRPGDPPFPAPIHSQGPAVMKIQQALGMLGHPLSGMDGVYGQETYDAVLAYKRQHSLRTETGYLDGIVGPKTVRHMDDVLARRAPGKTTVLVSVRDNLGQPKRAPGVVVRLRDARTGATLGSQRATSPMLRFLVEAGPSAALRIDTSGDPRFWPQTTSVQTPRPRGAKALIAAPAIPAQIITGRAAVPRLRDITDSKDDLEDVGMQSGRWTPNGDDVSCGLPQGTAPLPKLAVLSTDPKACRMDRLQWDSLPHGPPAGRMRILASTTATAATDPPGLFMVWIHDRLDLANADKLDFHVYLHPNYTGGDISPSLEYPLGRQGFSDKVGQPYVGKGYSHLMWRTWGNYQHHLAARACVFVVPMAPVNGHFSKLTPAGLASFLREIAAVITPMARSSPPDVGDVALSGFSGGCQWLPHLLSQSRNPASAAFLNDNVKELYLFDSAVTDANNLAPLLPQFLRQGETGKVVRSYTRFSATHAAIAPHVSTHPRDRRSVSFPQGTAVEVHSARGSSIFIPETLLIKGCTQTKDCRIPIPDLSGQNWAHDWFVRFFMAHALRFSVFRPLPEPPPEEGLDRAQSPSL